MRPLLVIAALCLNACTYTAAVTQTNVPPQRDHPVEVDVKRFIFFATLDTDEVSRLTAELQQKCPGGRVTGILTKDLRTMYFLFIFWQREVIAKGFCVKGKSVAMEEL